MWKRPLVWSGAALVVALLVAWGIGELIYPGTNPPERHRGLILSQQGDRLLRRACFDCHSNETRHPWYVHLPVAALIAGNHIRAGRAVLNFSLWDRMAPDERRKAIEESLESVQEREMPTLDYLLLHPEAKLDTQAQRILASDAMARYGVSGEEHGRKHGQERGEEHEPGERD